jgi:hypothetical protein
MLDWLGWSGLTPSEQVAAVSGGAAMLGGYLALQAGLRVMFGGLLLRRRRAKGRKAKPRRRR